MNNDPEEADIEAQEEAAENAADDIEIPEEEPTRQEIVEFLHDKLPAALTASGGVFISLAGMCHALGLRSQSQIRRIKNTSSLLKGLRRIPIGTRGGTQSINCLRVDKIGLWLAGIETTRMKQLTVKQQTFREKIERYQDELAPVATQVFLRVLNEGIQLTPTTQAIQTESPLLLTMAQQMNNLAVSVPSIQAGLIDLLAAAGTQTIQLESLLEIVSTQSIQLESLLEIASSQTLDLKQAATLLTRYLESQQDIEEKLERVDIRTKRLSPAHALEVQNAVGHIVRAIQRKNPSMNDQIANRMVYGRLKSRFRPATSYKDIDDDRFEEVIEFLRKEYRSVGEGPNQNRLF